MSSASVVVLGVFHSVWSARVMVRLSQFRGCVISVGLIGTDWSFAVVAFSLVSWSFPLPNNHREMVCQSLAQGALSYLKDVSSVRVSEL